MPRRSPLVLLALAASAHAFLPPFSVAPRAGRVALRAKATADLSEQMREMREAMAADEKSAAFIDAMRGTNINDDDAAAAGTSMRVVEMRRGDDALPVVYDPEALAAYFRRRPGAVLTRIAQIAVTAGGQSSDTIGPLASEVHAGGVAGAAGAGTMGMM